MRFWGAAFAAKVAKIREGGSITFTTGIRYSFMDGTIVADLGAGTVLVRPTQGWSLGSAVAGAVDAYTRALAVEMAPIRVNSVCPGAVMTEVSII